MAESQPDPLAPPHRVAELPAQLACLAAGPQRIQPSGPGLSGSCDQQKGRCLRVYLPPDANCLLSVADHCLRSRHYVNVIVAGKQPALQWLNMDAAIKHCTPASGSGNGPATTKRAARRCHGLLRRRAHARNSGGRGFAAATSPDLKIRVVNVVDLMTLQPHANILTVSPTPISMPSSPPISR